jgi:hypothetical protein
MSVEAAYINVANILLRNEPDLVIVGDFPRELVGGLFVTNKIAIVMIGCWKRGAFVGMPKDIIKLIAKTVVHTPTLRDEIKSLDVRINASNTTWWSTERNAKFKAIFNKQIAKLFKLGYEIEFNETGFRSQTHRFKSIVWKPRKLDYVVCLFKDNIELKVRFDEIEATYFDIDVNCLMLKSDFVMSVAYSRSRRLSIQYDALSVTDHIRDHHFVLLDDLCNDHHRVTNLTNHGWKRI